MGWCGSYITIQWPNDHIIDHSIEGERTATLEKHHYLFTTQFIIHKSIQHFAKIHVKVGIHGLYRIRVRNNFLSKQEQGTGQTLLGS